MATSLYNGSRVRFAKALIDWEAADVKAILVDTAAYTFNATHEFLTSIPAGARVGTAVELEGKVVTADGAADADNLTFPAVTGPSAEALVLYIDGGTEGTSPLVIFIDQATGLPIVPNTGDIVVQWDSGVNRIFRF